MRLWGGGDHHTAHIHPQGIISSACYLILPAGRASGDGALEVGRYELVFEIGAYFEGFAVPSDQPFLDDVPIRFGIDDAEAHYHIPLLASPFSFSTYRGS